MGVYLTVCTRNGTQYVRMGSSTNHVSPVRPGRVLEIPPWLLIFCADVRRGSQGQGTGCLQTERGLGRADPRTHPGPCVFLFLFMS